MLLPQNYQKKSGFTLIELLIVITIIGILAGLSLVSYSNAQARGRDSRRKQDLDTLKKTLELALEDTTGQSYFPNCTTITNGGCALTNNSTTTALSPTYIQNVPTDPVSNTGYFYAPTGCNGNNCTGYT